MADFVVCRQLQKGPVAGQESYTGMLDCFGKIIRNEGYASPYMELG